MTLFLHQGVCSGAKACPTMARRPPRSAILAV
jgi:hypothetical protein